jgi:hypothetical protein
VRHPAQNFCIHEQFSAAAWQLLETQGRAVDHCRPELFLRHRRDGLLALRDLAQPSSSSRTRISAASSPLDEAHKYMTDSAECQALTESLTSTIRLQRHIATRVVISTQKPTISPRLLDLCSVTIVHRITSPDWMKALQRHLAGASSWLDPSME